MNIISLYLCKSIFAFIEVFVGITVLLFLLKKYKLLTAWLVSAMLAFVMIFLLNMKLIPRLDDIEVTLGIRYRIWELAKEQFLKKPLFGQGYMTFLKVYEVYYKRQIIPHSHSIYFEMLLNFGVTGTVLLVWYFMKYYAAVITACFKGKKTMITSLILSVSAATFIHGITDLTLLWIQTLPLFLIILSGLGGVEKIPLNKKRRA
jgi:O-antigen ligase